MKKISTNFPRNNRRPRLCWSLLYLPYERGELQLPSLSGYHWAAQIRAAMCWFLDGTSILWVEIERSTTTPLPLSLYFFSDSPKKLKKRMQKPFVRNTVEVWFKESTKSFRYKFTVILFFSYMGKQEIHAGNT